MTKYEIIFEALQEKVDCGELTVEQAEEVNDLAYDEYITEKLTPEERRLKKIYIKNENEKENERKSDHSDKNDEIKVSDKDAETLHKSHDYLMKLANNHNRESDDKIALAHKVLKKKLKVKDDEEYGYRTFKSHGKVSNTVKVNHQYGYGETEKEKFDRYTKKGDFSDMPTKEYIKIKKDSVQPTTIYHGSKTGATTQIRPSQYSISDSKYNTDYDDKTDSGSKFSRLYPKRRIYGAKDPNDYIVYAYGGPENLHRIESKGRAVHSDPLSRHFFIEYEDELEDIEQEYKNNKINQKEAKHKMDSLYRKILKSGKKDTEKILKKINHAKNKIFKK